MIFSIAYSCPSYPLKLKPFVSPGIAGGLLEYWFSTFTSSLKIMIIFARIIYVQNKKEDSLSYAHGMAASAENLP